MKRILSFLLFAAFLMPWSAQAQKALPYNYGFEDNDLTVDGWTTSNTSGLNASKFGIDASAVKTGTYGFRFSSYDDNGASTQCLISPELVAPNGLVAQFYYKNSSSSSAETFKVGYSTTTTDLESFTWGEDISATGGAWTLSDEFSFPAGTKYVALYYSSNYKYYLYVDDVAFMAPPTCIKPATLEASAITAAGATLTWTAGNNESSFQYVAMPAGTAVDWTNAVTVSDALTADVTGLTAETNYDIYLRAYCSESDQSDARMISITTLPTCVAPDSLNATPASTSSATITWVAGNGETAFDYVYALAGEEPDWTGAVTVNALTATISNLDQDANYVFYVRANCGEEDLSAVRNISFHAMRFCTPAPTSVDGSGITAVALGGVAQTEAVHKTSAPYYADNSTLTFEVAASTMATVDVTYATGYTYGTVIWVDWNNDMEFEADELVYAGTSASTNPTTLNCTFTVPATQAEGTYRMRIGGADSYFDTYVGGGAYNAEYPCSNGTYRLYEDYSITVTAAPACMQPATVEASAITADGATLTWTASGSETQFQYVVMPKDTAVDWTTATLVTGLTATVTGLAANTPYDVYVRAYCGETEQSDAISTSFRTACDVVATFPWSENFDEVEVGNIAIPCWENEHIVSVSSRTDVFKVAASATGNTTHVGQLPDMQSGNITHLTLPAMNIPAANAYEFIISVYRNATGTSYPEEGLRILAINSTDTAELAFISRNCTQAYTVDETVVVPAEEASGWYTYNFALPLAGVQNIVIRGESKYGSSTYFDNLVVRQIPNCTKLASLAASDPTADGITLTWVAGKNETQFQYVIMPKDSAVDWTGATTVTALTAAVTGLDANTPYDAYVRAYCGEEEQGEERMVSFRTACGVEELPYADGFENGIYCWTVGNMQSTSSSYIPSAYGYSTHGGSYCLKLHAYVYTNSSYPTNADSAYAVLPAINYGTEGMNAYRLRFYARQNTSTASYNTHLYVGTLTDPEDMSTFMLVQDVVVEGTTYQQYEVSLANYTGEGQYLVLLATIDQTATATSRYGSFYVDDLTIDLIPACTQPATLVAADETAEGATLTWTAGGNETQFQYVVMPKDTAVDWTNAVTISDTTATVTGLIANTLYDAYVRAYCSESDQSEARMTSFRTACGIEAIPYADGFENGIYCWTVGNKQSTNTSYGASVSASYKYSGNNGMRLYALNYTTSSGTHADSSYAVLPQMNFETPGISNYTLTFYAKSSTVSAYYDQHILVGVVTDPSDMNTFTLVREVEVTGSFAQYEVQFDAYEGTGTYMALLVLARPTGTNTYAYGSIYVDDIAVTRTPACQPLASITAVPARTKVTVTLNPKAGLELGAAYDLVCSDTTLDAEALEAAEKTVVTDSVYTITGLERETPYYIYVRANCGTEDGVSPWVSTTVTTKNVGPDCSDATPAILLTGNGTTAVDYVMWGSFYNRTYSQQLYTAAEMTEAGLTPGYISKVAFQYAYSSAYSKTVTLYMGLTEDTVFATSSFLTLSEVSEATPINFETAGTWYEIELSEPLYWDGVSNVVIGAMSRGTNYSPNGSQMFYGGTTTVNRAIYSRADSSDPSMTTGTLSMNRADVRFTICPLGSPCPAVTNMAVALVGDGTSAARISWTTADADYLSSYDLLLSTTEVTDFSEVTPTVTDLAPTDTSYIFGQLAAETHYYFYIRANCTADNHNEGSSDWVGVDTTMNAACAAPNTLVAELIGLNAVKASWNKAFAAQALDYNYILLEDSVDAAALEGLTPVHVDSNVMELNNLNYGQDYYLYVAAGCGSPYISTSFTTYAACAPVENLTAARVEHNRVQLTWTKNPFGTETAYEVGIMGEESNAVVVTEPTAMLIGLTPETFYNAYVKAICSESSESMAMVVSFTTGVQPVACGASVGTGTASANLIYTTYGNTYSQQIYTAAELLEAGYTAGTIRAISFYYTGTSSTYDKTQSIYMGTTESTSFAGYAASDFIGGLTLVYAPTLLSYQAGWREYIFTTPFEWDGTSNIVIGMLTNSTQTSASGWSTRGTSTSPDYRSIYRYRDSSPIDVNDLASINYGSRSNNRPNIQLCFDPEACPDVTALTVSNIGTTTATATWEPMGSETSWNVYLSTTEVADKASIVADTIVNVMRYDMSGLMVDQDYWFYVQPVCTGADSWKVVTFRTVATCFPPMALTARDITANTAIVCWQDTNAVGNYTVLYGPSATFDLEEPASYETRQAADSILLLEDLLPYTNYTFTVRCNCEDMSSRYSTTATFRTGAGIPFEPVFGSTTRPSDWGSYNGLFNADTIPTSALTSGSKWSLVTGTDAIEGYHFKANIYGTDTKGWVVTPAIDLTNVAEGTGMILRFDAALCKWNNPTTAPTAQDTDDKFAVIVSVDGGLTWQKSNMTLWQNADGADYNYYDIPVTGKTYYIDMTQYAGYNIAIAFYGESTVSGPDNDFHFGNISLNYGTYTVYEETACEGDGFPKHGFNEASSEEAGEFVYERYTPATEGAVQQYERLNLTVNPAMSGLVELDILYVGDHYVDQYVDTIVQLADMEEGYYGFFGETVLGCDSSWFVVFNEIREAITLYDSLQIYNGDVRTWHNIEITEPGIKCDTIRSELGGVMAYCQLTVSLLDVERYSDSIELAEGATYIWRDSIEITEPGFYIDSVYSEFGGLMAIYELTVTAALPPVQGKTYELVTAPQTDWSGNYLIVFADNKAHATVSSKDLAATSDVLTISEDNKIVTADSCFVTVAAMGTDYSVQLPNGNYLGAQKNGVTSNANAVALTFNYTADGVQIAGTASGTEYILYCNTNNGTFYRMYVDKTGTSGYTLPQLYKEVTGEGPATKVETINAEDGAVKVILNGNLYIIRDNRWYDATGRLTVDPRK